MQTKIKTPFLPFLFLLACSLEVTAQTANLLLDDTFVQYSDLLVPRIIVASEMGDNKIVILNSQGKWLNTIEDFADGSHINIATADFDFDGEDDIIVNVNKQALFYKMDGTKVDYSVPLAYEGNIAAGEIDGEGWPEFLTTSKTPNGNSVFIYRSVRDPNSNDGNLITTIPIDSLGKNTRMSIATADLNQDGTVDIIIAGDLHKQDQVALYGLNGKEVHTFPVFLQQLNSFSKFQQPKTRRRLRGGKACEHTGKGAPKKCDKPTPEPQPQPEPKPQPESSPAPEPAPKPKPQPESSPAPEPAPKPKPQPESSPAPESTPKPQPEPEPSSAPESAPKPQPEPKPTLKPSPEPEPAPESQPELIEDPETISTTTPGKDKSVNPKPTPKPAKPEPEPEPVTTHYGVQVATGNVYGNDNPEIIVGMASKGGIVEIYTVKGKLINRFDTYFDNGVEITTGDINQDDIDEIIVGDTQGTSIRIFDADGNPISEEFQAIDTGNIASIAFARKLEKIEIIVIPPERDPPKQVIDSSTPTPQPLPLTGNITESGNYNEQTITDAVIEEGVKISNVQLAGNITNNGSISNATILPDTIVNGGTLQGRITNYGQLENVTLGEDTYLEGGYLANITGNADDRNLIENATIVENTQVSHLIIGAGVQFEPNVIIGDGILFGDNQYIPVNADLTRSYVQNLPGAVPVVDMNTSIIVHPEAPSLLEQINSLQKFQAEDWQVQQNPSNGQIELTIEDIRFAILPVQVTQVEASQPAGVQVYDNNTVTLVTHLGREILAQPVAQQDMETLLKALSGESNDIIVQSDGTLQVKTATGWVTYYPALSSYPVSNDTPLGLFANPDGSKRLVFVDETGQYRQQLFYVVPVSTTTDGIPTSTGIDFSNCRIKHHVTQNGSEFVVPKVKSAKFAPGQANRLWHDEAELDVGTTAMDSTATLCIRSLNQLELPPLDSSMVNVTKGPRRGYQFLPKGTQFKENVKVKVPFSKSSLPEGYTEQDIKTLYFDRELGRWVELEKVAPDSHTQAIISHTNHFTTMINAVVVAPDAPANEVLTPETTDFRNKANPGAGIHLCEKPQANSTGAVRIACALEVSPGRAGLQPQLAIQYNSLAGNGWLGMGWHLSIPAITIDTRWGAARYDVNVESETYLLNGEQLTPVVHRDELQPRTSEKIFHTRVESEFRQIIRHGDQPNNYWWEVRDKNGTAYYYGADPSTNGPVADSTLTDANGNIFKWALREVRDTNNNNMQYRSERVMHAHTPRGYDLYLKTIYYTGYNNQPGHYQVRFIRNSELGENRRPDVMSNGDGGFMRVTADLLRKIEVSFGQQIIRHYELTYTTGAFQKTLLQSIIHFGSNGTPLNTHTFDYYDDSRHQNGHYKGFTPPQNWNAGQDNINAGFNHSNASAMGATKSETVGGVKYLGLNNDHRDKVASLGARYSFSMTQSEGLVTFLDITGDRLPDKIFKQDGQVYYRPNQSGPDGITQFGDKQLVEGLPAIFIESSRLFSVGPELYLDDSKAFNANNSFTKTESYFIDVNADGLVDFIHRGQVLFNHRNNNGHPSFSIDSTQTPAPILGNSADVDNNNLVKSYESEQERQLDVFPLVDSIRRWEVPYDGEIQITGTVTLLEDSSEARQQYTSADGVRVTIQHESTELWSSVITANDYAPKTPTGVDSINVSRGDMIYFRVQSRNDGAYDQVNWVPDIRYNNKPATLDVNDLDIYHYNAEDDFFLSGYAGMFISMPFAGTVRITGELQKLGSLTDDITLLIYKNEEIVVEQTINWDQVGSIVLAEEISVMPLDHITAHVKIDSQVDLTKLVWKEDSPLTLAYIDSPTLPVQDVSIQTPIFCSYDMYPVSDNSEPYEPWQVPKNDNFKIAPLLAGVNIDPAIDTTITMTFKRQGELVKKHSITVSGGTINNGESFDFPSTQGDKFYIELSTTEPKLVQSLTQIDAGATDTLGIVASLPMVFRSANPYQLIAQPYRGWSVFGYDGNRERANQPIQITEADLTGEEFKTAIKELRTANDNGTLDETFHAEVNGGLVAYYPFNGNANDEGGNGLHGTVTGATLTTDRFGNANSAYHFDGDDYINMGNSPLFDVNHHTITAWIKTDISAGIAQIIVGKVNPTIHETITLYLAENILRTNFATGVEQNHYLSGSSAIEKDRWYFVALTYDGETAKLYVDGNVDSSFPRTGTVRTNTNALAIGKHGGDPEQLGEDHFFNGSIDDVRIYNRALSESEISDLYGDGLVAYYPFDSNANDESGNELHGTVNGATLTTDRFGNANSAYYFDGIDDYIKINDNALFDVSDVTIMAWAKWEGDTPTDSHAIMSSYSGRLADSDELQHYGLRITSSSASTFFYDDGSEWDNVMGSSSIDDGEWHFIVGVLTAGVEAKIYVDGQLENTDTDSIPTSLLPSSDLYIGRDGTAEAESKWNGVIDELRIYNRALSVSEIGELYNLNSNTQTTNTDNGTTDNTNNNTTGTYLDDGMDGVAKNIKLNVIPFYPEIASRRWIGTDDKTWATADKMSSSRWGMDHLEVPTSNQFGGTRAVARLSQTQARSNQSGTSANTSSGSDSVGVLDYTDVNKDGCPDVVGNGKIQFSQMTCGLGSNQQVTNLAEIRKSGAIANSSVGGDPSQAVADGSGQIKSLKSETPPMGVADSLISGQSKMASDLRDLNGDGLPDQIIYQDNGELWVAFNLGYRFGEPEFWGNARLVMKSAGESLPDPDVVGFTTDTKSFAVGGNLSRYSSESFSTLLDINGDGLLDFLVVAENDKSVIQVALNTGNGFGASLQWPNSLNKGLAATIDTALGEGNFYSIGVGPLLCGDDPLEPDDCYVILNPGHHSGQNVTRPEIKITDIDGDGYPDFLYSQQDNAITVARNPIGRTNLLKTVQRPLGATITVDYQRTGNTYEQPQSLWVMSRVEIHDGHPGDGVDTQVTTYHYENGFYNRQEREFYGFANVIEEQRDPSQGDSLYRTITRQFHNDSYYNKGLLEKELTENASGQKYLETENSYFLRQVDNGNPLSNPNHLTATGFPELRRIDQRFYEGQPIPGKTTYMTHEYDPFGNLIRFFDAANMGTTEDDVEAIIGYFQDASHYIVGKPDSIVIKGNGQLMRQRQATFEAGTGNLKQLREYLANGSAAITNFMHDQYGNTTRATGPANHKGERYSLHYTYDNIVHTHIVQVQDSFGYTSTARYNLKYGKVEKTTDINQNTVEYSYDPFGRLATIIGPLQTGTGLYTMRYEYHPEADVPWAKVQHIDVYRNSNDPIESVFFIDGLQRVVQTKKDITHHSGVDSLAQDVMQVSGPITFDFVGRTIEQYYPIIEALGNQGIFNPNVDSVPPTRMSYDVLDRLTRKTNPANQSTRTAYGFGFDRDSQKQFRITETDANNISQEIFCDVRNLTTALKQFNHNGAEVIWTSYQFDALKQITAVKDDKNNITTASYDNLGRRTVIDNPDMGLTETVYDLASNVIKKITANLRAEESAIVYDYTYNRLNSITYPIFSDNNVSYTYGLPGAAHNGANRIIQVEDQSGTEERFYGQLGEVVKIIKDVNSDTRGNSLNSPEIYTTEYVYDTWNRLQVLTYPDGEVLTNQYDAGGLLRATSGEKAGFTYAYLNRLEYDKFEDKAFMELGNGIQTVFRYDAAHRRLVNLTTQGQNRLFQDLSYTYDNVGNILSQANAATVTSPSQMGGATQFQYQYDDLYRLTNASGSFTQAKKTHHSQLEMVYDSIHNIKSKHQQHEIRQPSGNPVPQQKTSYNWQYTYEGSQPHAPTQIGRRNFQYDANGNQLGWDFQQHSVHRHNIWNEENRLQSLMDNGHTMSYKYNDVGKRVIKSGPQGETVYVNPYYVIRNNSTATKHIYAGKSRIVSKLAKKEKSGANPKNKTPQEKDLYFYHRDHLGSGAYVTDANGKIYQHLEYFPFGETFIEEVSNVQRTPFWFTAKELDEETGLYYVEARYFDPRTSVWLSTDPILDNYLDGYPNKGVFDPTNLALYTYVKNSPIVFVDPTGLYWGCWGGAFW